MANSARWDQLQFTHLHDGPFGYYVAFEWDVLLALDTMGVCAHGPRPTSGGKDHRRHAAGVGSV